MKARDDKGIVDALKRLERAKGHHMCGWGSDGHDEEMRAALFDAIDEWADRQRRMPVAARYIRESELVTTADVKFPPGTWAAEYVDPRQPIVPFGTLVPPVAAVASEGAKEGPIVLCRFDAYGNVIPGTLRERWVAAARNPKLANPYIVCPSCMGAMGVSCDLCVSSGFLTLGEAEVAAEAWPKP